jgi:hypothetical protein
MGRAPDFLVHRRRVDWATVIADLNTAGVSGYRLCAILCLDWPTVRHWRDGGEPAHSRGVALLEVHARICGADRTELRMSQAALVI